MTKEKQATNLKGSEGGNRKGWGGGEVVYFIFTKILIKTKNKKEI